MQRKTSPIRLLPLKAFLLALLASACGCGVTPPAVPPTRAYINVDSLVPLHPGAEALRQLEEEIRSLSSLAGVDQPLPSLSLPPPVSFPQPPGPPPTAPEAQSFFSQARQAGEAHLEALGGELAETRARKVALRRTELTAALSQEMKTEEARAQEALWSDEQELFRGFSRRLFNLNVGLARKKLPDKEKEELQKALRQVEAEQEAALAVVRQKSEQNLAALKKQKLQKVEDLLARHEAELRAEDEAVLAEHRSRMEAELSTAAARLQKTPPAQPAPPPPTPSAESRSLARQLSTHRGRAQAAVTGSKKALLAELEKLKAARARLWNALREEVKAALEEIAADRGLIFIFDPAQAQRLPDYTDRAAAWLKDYWQPPDARTPNAQ